MKELQGFGFMISKDEIENDKFFEMKYYQSSKPMSPKAATYADFTE